MTYNLLADYLAQSHKAELYSKVPACDLNWSQRLRLVLQEILHYRPDVICLQEVDNYSSLEHALVPEGYRGNFVMRSNGRQDGCAVFWKAARLEPQQVQCIHMSEHNLRDNVAQVILFEVKADPPGGEGQAPPADAHPMLLVANTHLLFNPGRGDIKIAQLCAITSKMAGMISEAGKPTGAVLAGDLNLTPDGALYDFLSQGKLDCITVDRKRLSGQIENFGSTPSWMRFQPPTRRRHVQGSARGRHSFRGRGIFYGRGVEAQEYRAHGWMAENLEIATMDFTGGAAPLAGRGGQSQQTTAFLGLQLMSTHASALRREPDFTSAHDKSVSTIDYILYTPVVETPGSVCRMSVSAVLMGPPQRLISRGLPSSEVGSDHFCQVSDLILTIGASPSTS
mmetsp:Transcript_27483/g.65121  ORF Transcript_27483/g.65121 Transcript_27483/m.65121 type:complete len:395 (+) Transcript_27483:987-2171(+)